VRRRSAASSPAEIQASGSGRAPRSGDGLNAPPRVGHADHGSPDAATRRSGAQKALARRIMKAVIGRSVQTPWVPDRAFSASGKPPLRPWSQAPREPAGLGADEGAELPAPVGEPAAQLARGRVVELNLRPEGAGVDPQRRHERGEPGEHAGERVGRVEAKAFHGAHHAPGGRGGVKGAGDPGEGEWSISVQGTNSPVAARREMVESAAVLAGGADRVA
jgi:hypothetical protein